MIRKAWNFKPLDKFIYNFGFNSAEIVEIKTINKRDDGCVLIFTSCGKSLVFEGIEYLKTI
jgi:hypothetical protein